MSDQPAKELIVLGWREWLSLPDLGIERIKAKVDTGARTSALHVEDLEEELRRDGTWLRFRVAPDLRKPGHSIIVESPLLERRRVRSSNGVVELRPVIHTRLGAGIHSWPIEITLTSRSLMSFPMLLGRQALRKQALVHPSASYLIKKLSKQRRPK